MRLPAPHIVATLSVAAAVSVLGGRAAVAGDSFAAATPVAWRENPLAATNFTPVDFDVEPAAAPTAAARPAVRGPAAFEHANATLITNVEFVRYADTAPPVAAPEASPVVDLIDFVAAPDAAPRAAAATPARLEPVDFVVPQPPMLHGGTLHGGTLLNAAIVPPAGLAHVGLPVAGACCDEGCVGSAACSSCEPAGTKEKFAAWCRDFSSKVLRFKRKTDRDANLVFEFPTVVPSGCPYGYHEATWRPFCTTPGVGHGASVRVFDAVDPNAAATAIPPTPAPAP